MFHNNVLIRISYLCSSAGLILGGAVKPLGYGGSFLMDGSGAWAVATGVLAGIPACPTVVSFFPPYFWRRHCALISGLPVQFRNGAGETGNILYSGDQLVVAERERGAGLLVVALSVATNTQSLVVAVDKFAMASTVSCRYTWLAAWWSTIFAAW